MSNFDLIDDYLTNRLSGSDRSEFEVGMDADPALKMEVERQQLIVDGIRKARANELKAMLNQVPVGGASLWGESAILKIAATIGVAGLIGTAMYYYNSNSVAPMKSVPSAEIKTDSLIPKNETSEAPLENKPEVAPEKSPGITTQRTTKLKNEETKAPKIDIVDPSQEMLSEEPDGEKTLVTNSLGISMATIQVERDSQNKTFKFHYQFSDQKLFLFGPFDEALYEILEIHGDKHALFLYFKENFYLLNQANTEVTELFPIRDRLLNQKLKEFRNGK